MKRMSSIQRARLFITVGVTIITGCSSAPSKSDGETALENLIKRESRGIIKLVDFEKTKGRTISGGDKSLYFMDYEAEIEFTTDCYWSGRKDEFEVLPESGGPYNPSFLEGKKRVTKGQREKVTGALRFEWTGDAWREEAPPKAFSVWPQEYRDMVLNDLNNVAAAAYEYRQRPSSRGGGGGSYLGFVVPAGVGLGVTLISVEPDQIVIEKERIQGTIDKNGTLRTD